MEEIAQVYARSLFEVATEQDKLDLVREQVGQFADALDESRELQTFLFSPYFSTEEKKAGLAKAVTDADEIVDNFFALLLENHRMPVIFRVRREYATWFVDLGESDGELFPASFWVHAVRGLAGLPDPVVGDAWFDALDEVVDVVVADPVAFRPRLDDLDQEYRRQLSARLARRSVSPDNGSPP